MISFELFSKQGNLHRQLGTKRSDGKIINSKVGAWDLGGRWHIRPTCLSDTSGVVRARRAYRLTCR